MKQFQKIQWIALALILSLGLVGCEMLAPDSNVSPTAPVNVSSDPANLANFWVGRGQNKLGVYTSETVLQLEVPMGSFVVEYETLSGIYHIVLSSEEGAFLAIGLLEGDTLVNVRIVEVTIDVENAEPDPTSPSAEEGVFIFYWPGSTVMTWESAMVTVIVGDINWSVAIIIIADGVLSTEQDIGSLDQVEPETFTITTEVDPAGAAGNIWPEYLTRIPEGASRSIKFSPYPTEVMLYFGDSPGISVMPIQQLGNGDGHLVIHDIREDIHIVATF